MRKTLEMFLLLCIMLLGACADINDNHNKELQAIVSGYGPFDEIVLTVSLEDMQKAGFAPGDCITATIGDKVFDLPYHTGYFTHTGELLIVDYPHSTNTVISATNASVRDRLPGLENYTVRLVLKEKGRYLDVEKTLGMKYSNNRDDFGSDEEFANAREVTTTGMARGILYRTASPFDNTYNRAPFVSEFLKNNGVKTVLNLSDNATVIGQYKNIPAYSKQMIEAGNVVLCKLDANFRGENFNKTLVSGLVEMMNHPAPYVIHCTEGKDRTGYACALLEALAGASYDEICDEYLVTYDNYFHITPENNPKACRLLLELRLEDVMLFFCGLDDASQLGSIDLSLAVQQHLLRYGMSQKQVQNLKNLLTAR